MMLPRPLVLLLAASLVLTGLVLTQRRRSWLARTTAAHGNISWLTRYSLGVTTPGERDALTVRRPLLHLYRMNQQVRVRWDPADHYPGRLRAYGRIDSFAGLWLGPLLWIVAGAVVLLVYVTRGAVNVRVRAP